MFGKVIVGIEEVSHGSEAIALARVLAPHGELHLVHAYPHNPVGPLAAEGWRHDLSLHAERLLADVARETGTEGEHRAVADLSPARALQMVAQELSADLIVVGSASHGMAGRLLAGSVARSTLVGAPCPVAVTPVGYGGSTPASVGVAFDASPEAREALVLAADLAGDRHAHLRVIHVVGVPHEVVAPMYPFDYAPHEWERHGEAEIVRARSVVEAAVADLGPDIDAEGEVIFGHARKELTAMTEYLDLLVMGSRGWGPARRVLLGSTSSHLVDHAACPVLVVPRAAAPQDQPTGDAVEVASV